ncbi:hypothetical protein [Nocardioides sp. SYSU D00038]|uniref:hypothetical protein n=1 Tax=Nocardioides sp. SYSU D00038 TaxID=2812554 RepID=UPI0019683C08|nr:hypothetical protein [Nocardioides sp. SYSU D00038]
MRISLRRWTLLVGGCVVVGVGVAMLLTADLGSDGFSTLVNGTALASDVPFWVCNLVVCVAFLAMAALRGVRPGVGTVVQVVVVGFTVSGLLEVLETPDGLPARIALLVVAFPVTALGIAAYLGSRTGAAAAEAAALAWDPPVPFRWSYSVVQGGGALVGWLLGATIGAGTIAVIVLLGPLVDLAARLLRLDVHQDGRET